MQMGMVTCFSIVRIFIWIFDHPKAFLSMLAGLLAVATLALVYLGH